MRAPSRLWSADGDGRNLRHAAPVSAPVPGGAVATAAATNRCDRLVARQAFRLAGRHRAHRVLPVADRLVCAATAALRADRRGMVGSGPQCLSRLAGATAPGRLLGIRARVVLLFYLWLISARSTLAGRSVLFGAGVRHRLAVVAECAAPRYRGVVFFRRAADPV